VAMRVVFWVIDGFLFEYPSLFLKIDRLSGRRRSEESYDPGIGEDQEDRRSLVKKRG